jgi:hypothetical protein
MFIVMDCCNLDASCHACDKHAMMVYLIGQHRYAVVEDPGEVINGPCIDIDPLGSPSPKIGSCITDGIMHSGNGRAAVASPQ